MKVFADTSALLALVNRDDEHHGAVTEAVRGIVARGDQLVTCSYVLVEAGALVRRRLGAAAFKALGEAVERAMDVVWVDQELHARAWEAACGSSNQGPSLVDHVSFLTMRSLGVETALALDAHFEAAGFGTLP